jgi:hypothetical protein
MRFWQFLVVCVILGLVQAQMTNVTLSSNTTTRPTITQNVTDPKLLEAIIELIKKIGTKAWEAIKNLNINPLDWIKPPVPPVPPIPPIPSIPPIPPIPSLPSISEIINPIQTLIPQLPKNILDLTGGNTKLEDIAKAAGASNLAQTISRAGLASPSPSIASRANNAQFSTMLVAAIGASCGALLIGIGLFAWRYTVVKKTLAQTQQGAPDQGGVVVSMENVVFNENPLYKETIN